MVQIEVAATYLQLYELEEVGRFLEKFKRESLQHTRRFYQDV